MVQWSWKSDNGWVAYDHALNTKIEAEYKKGQKRVKVDDERFVDVTHMLQRRYDDETKRREVKREEPPAGTDNDSSEEEEEEEAEADNDDDDDDDDDVGRWYWQQDDSSWVEYDRQKASEIEDAFAAGKRRVRIDSERFIDLPNLLQRRFDDESKRRLVKREGPKPAARLPPPTATATAALGGASLLSSLMVSAPFGSATTAPATTSASTSSSTIPAPTGSTTKAAAAASTSAPPPAKASLFAAAAAGPSFGVSTPVAIPALSPAAQWQMQLATIAPPLATTTTASSASSKSASSSFTPYAKASSEDEEEDDEDDEDEDEDEDDGGRELVGEARVEYAASGRSGCRVCRQKIDMDDLRVARMVQSQKFDGKIPEWHHYDCFFSTYKVIDIGYVSGASKVRWEDQEKLRKQIEADQPRAKAKSKSELKKEDALRDENEALWAIKDKLRAALDVGQLKYMLEHNKQDSKGGEAKLLDRCAEGMLFGALPPCPSCDEGQLVCVRGVEYKCTGYASAWGRCLFTGTASDVQRLPWKVPSGLKDASTYLNKWKFKPRKPVEREKVDLPVLEIPQAAEKKRKRDEDSDDDDDDSDNDAAAKKKKQQLESGVQKFKVKGKSAVHPDSGLDDDGHIYQSDSGTVYNVMLNLADITSGLNSYYALQLIELDTKKTWYVYRKWGRVGTTIGGDKKEKFSSIDSAKAAFVKIYEEKTENSWAHRDQFVKKPGKFYPIEIDYSGDDTDELAIKQKAQELRRNKSKLDKRIQDLVGLIFDIKAMQDTLLELEIDVNKMPLGKLSKRNIQQGYEVLTEIQGILKKGDPSNLAIKTRLTECANRFYTIIPHAYGNHQPPLIATEEQLREKTDMLEALLDMEIAASLLKDGSGGETLDPIEQNYRKLKTNMVPVDTDDSDWDMVSKYVTQTHCPTHTAYWLELVDLFRIEREGEFDNFIPFSDLPNRMLLWHGSRLTNYAGILSQGLRIAPPEAPVTGYMFGKGVYFADMSSKSANYCYPNREKTTGLMLLSEVALGNVYELTQAEYMDKAPQGFDSTKGCGKTAPDPRQSVTTPDGVLVPLGTPANTGVSPTSLLYNEFIVYNTGQINLKYLLRVKFHYY